MEGMKQPHRILCTREYQTSIEDSVHKLLADKIQAYGLGHIYTVTQRSIKGTNGTEFIFAGLRHSIQSIKSKAGITKCWVEEAQCVARESWKILLPTVREAGCEVIVTFNPEDEKDEVWQLFCGSNPLPDSICIEMNWRDNPWFPEEMNKLRLRDKALDYDEYLWIWEGQCRRISDACILKGKYMIEAFEVPERTILRLGADFGHGIDGDPCTLVGCYEKDDRLYIPYELYIHEAELDDLPKLYDAAVPGCRKYKIYGDASRPETINHLRRKGFNIAAAAKWQGSVDDGIAFLKKFQKIVIHPRCKHTAEEARLWSWKVDRKTEEIYPIPAPGNEHCWDGVRYALSPLIRKKGTSIETWIALNQ